MTTITWGGSTGDWKTAADWNGGVVPTGDDDVIINAGIVQVSASDAGVSAQVVTIGSSGALEIADPGQTQSFSGALSDAGVFDVDATGTGGSIVDIGGVLTDTGAATFGNASQTAATLVQAQALTDSGALTIEGGSASATTTLALGGGASVISKTVTMNAFGDLSVGGTLTIVGGTVNGGTLSTTAAGVIDSENATFNGVTIALNSNFTVVNSDAATISGTTTIDGQLLVGASGGATLDIAAAGATLEGVDQIILFDSASSSIAGSGALVNVDVTIQGSGSINGLSSFDNQAGGVVEANQSVSLTLSVAASSNEGVIEATNGALLELGDGITLTQDASGADGDLLATGAGSLLELFGATVVGGTLSTAGGGLIESENSTLQQVIIASGATVLSINGDAVTLSGTIDNQGEIEVGSSGAANLDIAKAGATLSGGGQVVLFNSSSSSISGGALVNADDTIAGSGSITNLTSFANQAGGLILANQSVVLAVGVDMTNAGEIEAVNGATLELSEHTVTQSGGDIRASGVGSIVELFGAIVDGGTLTTFGGGMILSQNSTVEAATIAANSTLAAATGDAVTLSGAIVNLGEIEVGASGAANLDIASAGATLTGGGTVKLFDSSSSSISGGALINVDDTIEGSGAISGLSSFDNQAGGIIDADQSVALDLGAAPSNEGLIEATFGATLVVDLTTLTQNGGEVAASGAGSVVEFYGANDIGGTLADSGGGVITVENGEIQNATITLDSTVDAINGTTLTLAGAIVDSGAIDVGTSTGASLAIAKSGVTLSGGGVVTMFDSSSVSISGSGALTNVDDIIQGSGQIGGLASINNEASGLIEANQSVALNISSISGGITNNGVLAAANGATLVLDSAISGGGQLTIGTSSKIELESTTAETVAFSGAGATFEIVTPTNFTGAISGFAVGDTIDLGSTTATTATPTANGANTTLTVALTSGGPLTFTLIGNYVGDTFAVTRSGNDSLITISAATTPPTLGGAGNVDSYAPGTAAIVVDSGLTAKDPTHPNATGATVAISAGLLSGDTLGFVNQGAIKGSYDAATGVLTLSGAASVAAYQTALQSVTFASADPDPTDNGTDTSRTLSWLVNDVGANSNAVSSTIDIATPPALSAGNVVVFTPGGPAEPVDATLTAHDNSNLALTGASVAISNGLLTGDALGFANQAGITGAYNSANGVLTLTGSATLAQYQSALDSVTYSSSASDPGDHGTDLARVVTWTIDAGAATSTPVTSTIDVAGLPVLSGAGATAQFTQGGAPAILDAGMKTADPSSATLTGATIAISSGFLAGDFLTYVNADDVFGYYDAATGVLSLSGTATLAAYQAELDSIAFGSTALDVTNGGADLSRALTWTVSDDGAVSAAVSSTVGVAIAAPVISGAGNTVNFTQGGPSVILDAALTISDLSSETLTGATVKISSGFLAGDTLTVVNRVGITGSYNATSGVLTLTGTASLAEYQTALESIAYSSSSLNVTKSGADPSRQISWTVESGAQASLAATSTVDVGIATPTLSGGGNTVTFTLGGAPTAIDAGVSVADESSPTLTSAIVKITAGFHAGDALGFVNQGGITGTYTASSGILRLAGTASLAAYRAALASITFSTTNGSFTARTISSTVVGAGVTSNTLTSTVDLAALPPVISGAGNVVDTFAQGPAVTIDPALTLVDQSSATLTSAVVKIVTGFVSSDVLAATTQGGVSASYNNATGVLTFSGTATLAIYQAILASVTFQANGISLANTARGITWTASDNVTGGQHEISLAAKSTIEVAESHFNWINPNGGSWNVASNWSTDAVPTASAEAFLGPIAGADDTYTVTSSQNNNVGALEITNANTTLAIADDVFTVGGDDDSINAGTIALANGATLNLAGILENTGTIQLSSIIKGGTIENAGGAIVSHDAIPELLNTDIVGGEINIEATIKTAATFDGSASPTSIGFDEINIDAHSSLTLKGVINLQGFILGDGLDANINIAGNVTVNLTPPPQGGSSGFLSIGSVNGGQSPNSDQSLTSDVPGSSLTLNTYFQVVGGLVGNSDMSLTIAAGGELLDQQLPTTLDASGAVTNDGLLAQTGRYFNYVPNVFLIDDPVVGTGVVQVDDQLEFASSVASGQTIEFGNGGDPGVGDLELEQAQSFSAGEIRGMQDISQSAFDAIDLQNFAFGHAQITSVSGTGNAGSLTNVTVSDPTAGLSVIFHLLNQTANQYLPSTDDYSLTSDAIGSTPGTVFSVDFTHGVMNTGPG